MQSKNTTASLVFTGLIVVFSLIVFLLNTFKYHFPGNYYFPENMLLLVLVLSLLNLGLFLCFGYHSIHTQKGRELTILFAIMSVIALATNAVQFTPFAIIDPQLLAADRAMHVDLLSLMTWTNQYPILKNMLIIIYDSLPFQMAILPLILIVFGRFSRLRNYYFLMLFTTLLGFSFYYFFPSVAPASTIGGSLFARDQFATGLKFHEIHHWISPTTIEGGLIAFPSFHVIWAVLCVYLLKQWFIPFVLLLIINVLLVASCVLLGWHYFVDVLGGLLLLLLGFFCLYKVTPAQSII